MTDMTDPRADRVDRATVVDNASLPVSGVPTTARQPRAPRRLVSVLLGLGVALAIVVAAVYVGGRENFEAIGQGGANRQLLPKVGETAPDFLAWDLAGRPVKLSDFRGQPVWLNFWGSWCPPCRAEMPDIQAAYEQLAPQGLTLLAISVDESALDAAAFAALNDATFTILSDPNRLGTGPSYPILNFPTHLFIDRDGTVRSVVLADMDVETAVAQGTAVL